jgi:hypothetical protein
MKITHGITPVRAEATIIAVESGVIWFEPAHGGRLKAPRRMMPNAAIGDRCRFTQLGDHVQKLEKI